MERQRSSARPNAKAENRLKVESSRPGLSLLKHYWHEYPCSGKQCKGLAGDQVNARRVCSKGSRMAFQATVMEEAAAAAAARATVMMRNAVKERIDGQLSDVDGFPYAWKEMMEDNKEMPNGHMASTTNKGASRTIIMM
ncbi:hypothetical protein OIU78_013676 [Salix suchowensis]|nr:hypothetical protein OIU78_013676 [Salix suchowensis]